MAAALVTMLLCALQASAQQASITLQNCAGELCQNNNTEWSLTKSGQLVGSAITWTVTATRGATSNNLIQVNGYIEIKNTGTANATIGNIVVNLTKPTVSPAHGVPYVSVAADCADATNGDTATTCNIVKAASQEDQGINGAQGAGNYATSGPKGTFTETAGSGSLNFTDATNNTVFSLFPQPSIAPNASVKLLYIATFNNTQLNLSTGSSLRVEVLVSFGNAGARGGSGSTASNIDINGNLAFDGDEFNVRSVPCRYTKSVPALEQSNNQVTLSDTDSNISQTGTVTHTNFTTAIGSGTGTEAVSATTTRTVSVDIDAGSSGGTITNTAHLDGQDTFVTVNGPINPLTGLPTFSFSFPCCVGIHLQAADTQNINVNGFVPGQFCTITQGGWGAPPHGNNPGALLATNFSTVYPSGFVEVGIPGASGFSIKLNGSGAVCNYLPAGGTPGTLSADIVTSLACSTGPSSPSTSSGVFGGQVLTLQLNVNFSAGNIFPLGLGNLSLCNLTDALSPMNGLTIAQVLDEARKVLGGGTSTYGLSTSQLNGLVDGLNNAFDDCTSVSAFAAAHLCR